MIDNNYILIDKYYNRRLDSYVIYLYDRSTGETKEVVTPITKTIDFTRLGDIENALQQLE